MSRPARNEERGARIPSKSSKHHTFKATRHHGAQKFSSSAMRPVKNASVSKVSKTVSAAGIFKKPKIGTGGKTTKRSRQRSPTPEESELDLDDYYREGLDEARDAINTNQELAFNNVHTDLIEKLAKSRANDEAFFERCSAVATSLGAPLDLEQIETTFIRDGKQVTEVVEIGKRVALFKSSVEMDAAKLKDLWAQWEEMQNDFIELGKEVFGGVAFDEDDDEPMLKGYKREMELLDHEHGARLEELMEEIENLKTKALQDTKVSEKDLSNASRREGARIIQAYMAEV